MQKFKKGNLDLEDFSLRLGNNTKILNKMLRMFYNDFYPSNQIFTIEMIDQDFTLFQEKIHGLKGVSGNISLTNIFNLCKQINKSDDTEAIKDIAIELLKELELTLSEVAEVLEIE